MPLIKHIMIVVVGLFLTLTALMYLFQRHLIYKPATEVPELKRYRASDMQVITIPTADGLHLKSWYKAAQPGQPTLLYLHGNAGHIGDRMSLGRSFLKAGLGLLLLEYRGYGGNPGSPTEEGLYEDARAGLRFLNQQGIPFSKIVLYGESLGSGVALALAEKQRFCTVILQSPYTSLMDLAHFHYPWIVIKPKDRFDSMSRIQSIQAPLLILHGLKDTVVPHSHGEALFQHAREPKKMLSYEVEGHNNIWHAPHFDKNVLEFIYQYCK